jgi:hypothetical protein
MDNLKRYYIEVLDKINSFGRNNVINLKELETF